MSKLAMLGGTPVRTEPFPAYNIIGDDEKKAVLEVLDTGVLSKYLGCWHPDFYGGPQVQAFEQEWAQAFGSKHAVAVNSATSGLYAAMGAVGIEPGDEVIVPPLSMSASATAAIVWGGVPIFCDIDPQTFNPCPQSIKSRITPRTKAIMLVHLLGHPVDMDPIMALAEEHGIKVIEDCAQAIHATYKDRLVGTIGHVGVFSLNYHKHIHTGEGGICTTNDAELTERMQLIRNHAEAVVAGKPVENLTNLVGFNFRLGEMEAALGRSLLKKSYDLVSQRRKNVVYLENKIGLLEGLSFARPQADCVHSYYGHAMHCNEDVLGISRDTLVAALRAELPPTHMREEANGPLLGAGYTKPLYMLPMYQKTTAFGSNGYPFINASRKTPPNYGPGLCPKAETACKTMLVHELMRPPMTHSDLDDVADAFTKVFEHINDLKKHSA